MKKKKTNVLGNFIGNFKTYLRYSGVAVRTNKNVLRAFNGIYY